jgi:cyanophycin synthetase
MVVEMAPLCDGEVIFFAIDPTLTIITEHRSRGGRAVIVRDDELVLAMAAEENTLVPLGAIQFIAGAHTANQLENVLAAVGAAWALGIDLHVIRTGVETFANEQAAPAVTDQLAANAHSSLPLNA